MNPHDEPVNDIAHSLDFHHQPVMATEIVDVFAGVPPGVVLDATLGGGGHSELILEAFPHLRILGIDRDQNALAAASSRLARFGDRMIDPPLSL